MSQRRFLPMLLILFACGLSAQVKQHLSWLPPETETLIVAAQPFTIAPKADFDTPTLTLRELAVAPLADFPSVRAQFAGREIRWAFTGVIEFNELTGFGISTTKSLTVIRFGAVLPQSIFGPQSGPVVSGFRVASFKSIREGSLRSRPETVELHAVQTAPDTLLLGTSLDVLRLALERREFGATVRDLSRLPEWQLVDPNVHAFAIRHHRRLREDEPLQEVTGLVYSASSGPSQRVVFLTNGQSELTAFAGELEDVRQGRAVKVARVAPGVMAVDLPLKADDEVGRTAFTLWLLVVLGYDVSI